MMDVISWRVLRRAGRMALDRQAMLRIEGVEHVPADGPVLIAARHYHHLLDGCALVNAVNRPLHIVVGLDWVEGPIARRMMGTMCRAARWPVVLRPEHPDRPAARSRHIAETRDRERRAVLRKSARETASLLTEGRVVVVFPEGYPNIDPSFTPKAGDGFLPFQPGFVRYAQIAGRSGTGPVPIVPAGFVYEREPDSGRWRITLRFGPAIATGDASSASETVRSVEQAVRELSDTT